MPRIYAAFGRDLYSFFYTDPKFTSIFNQKTLELTLNATKCQFRMYKLTLVVQQRRLRLPPLQGRLRLDRFIPDVAAISESLRHLTKAGTPFMFGREKKEVFEEWRDAFLEQKLGVFWQTREEFHSYIYGTPFELVTDRKPIEVVYGPKSRLCARIEWWVLRMQSYQFKVRYQPAPKNNADSLSLAARREEGNAHRKRKNMCDKIGRAHVWTPVTL